MRIMALPGAAAPAAAGASARAATVTAAAASRRVMVPRLTTTSLPRWARDGCARAITGWFGAGARAVLSGTDVARFYVELLRSAVIPSARHGAPNHPVKPERADVRS